MITKEKLTDFQNTSINKLRYEVITAEKMQVLNALNEKIAELNLQHASEGIYHDAWFGFVSPEEYKEIMEGPYLHYFSKAKCTKKVCNTLSLEGGMDPDTSAWFGEFMFPQLLKSGLKYNAVVIPEDIFAQQSMEEFEKNLGNNFGRLFPSQEKAVDWLRSV
jgi:hypothetical protein